MSRSDDKYQYWWGCRHIENKCYQPKKLCNRSTAFGLSLQGSPQRNVFCTFIYQEFLCWMPFLPYLSGLRAGTKYRTYDSHLSETLTASNARQIIGNRRLQGYGIWFVFKYRLLICRRLLGEVGCLWPAHGHTCFLTSNWLFRAMVQPASYVKNLWMMRWSILYALMLQDVHDRPVFVCGTFRLT